MINSGSILRFRHYLKYIFTFIIEGRIIVTDVDSFESCLVYKKDIEIAEINIDAGNIGHALIYHGNDDVPGTSGVMCVVCTHHLKRPLLVWGGRLRISIHRRHPHIILRYRIK